MKAVTYDIGLDEKPSTQGEFRMTGLKIMGGCWVAAICATPVVGQISPATATEKLMKGTTQTVLAVVVLGLSVAIIWTVKKLLNSHDERVQEAKANAQQQVQQANKMTDQMTKALSENSTALAQNATSNDQLKESLYHLSSVVDKKLDRTF